MYNKLELAKVHVKAQINNPGQVFYGVRAALRDGSERFKLSTAELVELHAYAQAMTASADTQPPHACPPPAPASAYTGSLWALAH